MNVRPRSVVGAGKKLGWAVFALGALALLLPALPGRSADGDKPAAQPAAQPQPTKADVADMVKKLGDAAWREREDAQNKLVGAGAPAVEELEKALKSDDAEIRQRAETALAAIRKNLAESASEAAARGRIWRSPVTGGVASSAAAGAGVVCFLTADGTLHAVDANTGKPKWTFEELDKDAQAGNANQIVAGAPTRPAPVIAGRLVYVSAQFGRLYALDLATGDAKWKSASTEGFAPPTASGGKVFAAGTEKDVHALNAATGKEIWTCELEGGSAVRPAVSGGSVYVAARDNCVYALDANTGKKRKLVEILAGATDVLVTKDGAVVVRTSAAVVCLDPADGAQKWSCPLPGGGILMRGGAVIQMQALGNANVANLANRRAPLGQEGDDSMVAFDGTVYAAGAGVVHAIDAASGKALWTYKPENKDEGAGGADGGNVAANVQVGGAVVIGAQGRVIFRGVGMGGVGVSAPCVAGGTMYVASPAGLHAVDLKTRQELWRLESKEPIAARPVVIDGVLYYGTSDQGLGGLVAGGGIVINNGAQMVVQGQPQQKAAPAAPAGKAAAGAADEARADDTGPALSAIKLKTVAAK